jgi:hypothetical protein
MGGVIAKLYPSHQTRARTRAPYHEYTETRLLEVVKYGAYTRRSVGS